MDNEHLKQVSNYNYAIVDHEDNIIHGNSAKLYKTLKGGLKELKWAHSHGRTHYRLVGLYLREIT